MTTPVLRMPAPPFPRGARPLADGGQMHACRPGDRTQRPAPEKAKKFPPRAGAARGFGPAPARQHMRQAHTVMRFRAPQPVDMPGAGNPTAGPVSLPAAPGSVECAGVRRLPPSALCAGRGNKKSESMTRFRPPTKGLFSRGSSPLTHRVRRKKGNETPWRCVSCSARRR